MNTFSKKNFSKIPLQSPFNLRSPNFLGHMQAVYIHDTDLSTLTVKTASLTQKVEPNHPKLVTSHSNGTKNLKSILYYQLM